MDMMTRIVTELFDNGYNSVAFGDNRNEIPPYVVVKKELDALGRGNIYRITMHATPGKTLKGDEDIRDIKSVMNNMSDEFFIFPGFTDPQWRAVNSDDTLSREQRFLSTVAY